MAHLESYSAPTKASQWLSCLFCLTGRGYQYAHANFFSFGLYHLNQLKKKYLCMYIDKQNQFEKKKKKYLCMYIDEQNQLKKKKKYYFFLFWPVTLQTLNGSSTVLVSTRSEEHTSELQSHLNLVCRPLLEQKKYI